MARHRRANSGPVREARQWSRRNASPKHQGGQPTQLARVREQHQGRKMGPDFHARRRLLADGCRQRIQAKPPQQPGLAGRTDEREPGLLGRPGHRGEVHVSCDVLQPHPPIGVAVERMSPVAPERPAWIPEPVQRRGRVPVVHE